jgi:hypothetical protein
MVDLHKLDKRIAELATELQKLRDFRENLSDPQLLELLNGQAKPPKRGRPRKHLAFSAGKKVTAFELVKKFILERNNEGASATQIRNGTGLDRGALSNLLYKQRKNDFDRTTGDDGPVLWRLKDAH